MLLTAAAETLFFIVVKDVTLFWSVACRLERPPDTGLVFFLIELVLPPVFVVFFPFWANWREPVFDVTVLDMVCCFFWLVAWLVVAEITDMRFVVSCYFADTPHGVTETPIMSVFELSFAVIMLYRLLVCSLLKVSPRISSPKLPREVLSLIVDSVSLAMNFWTSMSRFSGWNGWLSVRLCP